MRHPCRLQRCEGMGEGGKGSHARTHHASHVRQTDRPTDRETDRDRQRQNDRQRPTRTDRQRMTSRNAVCCLPFAVFVLCSLSFAVRRLPRACRMSSAISLLPLALCRLPFAPLSIDSPKRDKGLSILKLSMSMYTPSNCVPLPNSCACKTRRTPLSTRNGHNETDV